MESPESSYSPKVTTVAKFTSNRKRLVAKIKYTCGGKKSVCQDKTNLSTGEAINTPLAGLTI